MPVTLVHRRTLAKRDDVAGLRSGRCALSAVAGDSAPAYGSARYRNDACLSFESSKATASSSARPPEDPIFHAVEREPILGWPVSRRYDVDKRPLRCLGQADQIRKLPVRARHSGAQLSEPRVGRVDVFPFAYIRDDFAAALWCFARIGGLE